MSKRVDLLGRVFGKLTVICMADDYVSPSGHHLSRCQCQCECGKSVIVNMSSLVTGSTRSCGCSLRTKGMLVDYPVLVEKYDFEKNTAQGIDINSLTARTSQKVWWKCQTCGNSWFATIASQNDSKKHGCPYCAGNRVVTGSTDLETCFPTVAIEWNYEKNEGILPKEVSARSNTKVWWKCQTCGYEWIARIANRTARGSGCPKCNTENVNSFCEQAVYYYISKAFRDAINSDKHLGIELDIYIPSIESAIEYDGDVWHRSSKRVENDLRKNDVCRKNGIKLYRIREPNLPTVENCVCIKREDSTTAKSLDKAITQLLDCLSVSNVVVNTEADASYILSQYATKKKDNSLSNCFPELVSEWHPKKNGDLTPDKVNKGSRRIVWWLGKCGHEWQSVVSERTRPKKVGSNGKVNKARGCPICAGKIVVAGLNDLQTRFPNIAKEWHPDKNDGLNPSDILPGSHRKVWWLGKCGHEWQASPNKRCSDNKNCPVCFKLRKSPAVLCVETGAFYNNAGEAALSLNIKNARAIYAACRNSSHTVAGFHWKYAGEQ